MCFQVYVQCKVTFANVTSQSAECSECSVFWLTGKRNLQPTLQWPLASSCRASGWLHSTVQNYLSAPELVNVPLLFPLNCMVEQKMAMFNENIFQGVRHSWRNDPTWWHRDPNMLMISVETRATKLVASQPTYSVLHKPQLVVAEKTVGMASLATHIGFKTFKLVPICST